MQRIARAIAVALISAGMIGGGAVVANADAAVPTAEARRVSTVTGGGATARWTVDFGQRTSTVSRLTGNVNWGTRAQGQVAGAPGASWTNWSWSRTTAVARVTSGTLVDAQVAWQP